MTYGTMVTRDANQMLAYMRRTAQYDGEQTPDYVMSAHIIDAGY
jgi:hypothetical protein